MVTYSNRFSCVCNTNRLFALVSCVSFFLVVNKEIHIPVELSPRFVSNACFVVVVLVFVANR